ncbi:MAG: DUF559 domain-containing protein [Alphaproteobacteria bacterium]
MRESEQRSRTLARGFRRAMTNAEVILWSRLREHALAGLRFRRQHPIGPYVADFASVSLRLVIELDGATHSSTSEITHDRRRDAFLRKRGWHVLRFGNDAVYRHLHGVLETILSYAPTPAFGRTSPVNGGGKRQVP